MSAIDIATQLRDLATAGKRYACVLADPPWAFEGFDGSLKPPQRTAVKHYDVMPLDDLLKIPVGDVVAGDAALFMWIIDSHLPQALRLGEAWGFEYKTTGFVWHKMSPGGRAYIGLGHWTRSQGEICLLFTRGRPRRLDKSVRQFINAPVREHSRKPEDQYRRIETLVAGPRLELFARHRRPNWDVAGNEVGKFGDLRGAAE